MAQAESHTPVAKPQESVTVSAADAAVGAAFMASGIGAAVLGILTTASEVSKPIGDALNWVKPVGALSGKTDLTILAFIVSWAILHFTVKNVKLRTAFTIALVGLAIGLVFTFPPVFELLKGG
jgi:hypothetical protein